jgi:hypothetical protein
VADDKPEDDLEDGLRAMQEAARDRRDAGKRAVDAAKPIAEAAERTAKALGAAGLRRVADLHSELQIAAAERRKQERENQEDLRRKVVEAVEQNGQSSEEVGPKGAALPSEEKPTAEKRGGWTIFGTIRFTLTTLVVSTVLFVWGVFAESNIRHFMEDRGWDTVLTRIIAAMPGQLASYTSWLVIGLIFGTAAAIWLIWAFPHRLGHDEIAPKGATIKFSVAIIVGILIAGALYLSTLEAPRVTGTLPPAIPPTAPRPPPPKVRVYTDKTVRQLVDMCKGLSPLQCDDALQDEGSKWIQTGGTVNGGPQSDGQMFIEVSPTLKVHCRFDPNRWLNRLRALHDGEAITIIGKIVPQSNSYFLLRLADCELR